MLALARSNQSSSSALSNVSFIESNITSIPLEDSIADCIISNCVINLVPAASKPAVFREMGRLLKPGGRVAISDILARKAFSEKLRQNMALYVGCIAGCSRKEEYVEFLENNGFRGELLP
jgi:arsenite methyltransferase